MATIFYVHCPDCGGKFPCHSELWQVDYALLCPFCQRSFHQEESPLIISATGERRPGSRSSGGPADGRSLDPGGQALAEPTAHAARDDAEPPAQAESM